MMWTIIDGILLVAILCGNILTILAVRFSRRLRSVISNHFVLSLAISDILVGLTLPYHLAFYMGTGLGSNKEFCMLRFFFVIMACCVSIWNLIAIAVDRYIAICYPLHYSRYMTRRVALLLMAIGWLVGFSIAAIPVIWNKWEVAHDCEFDQIFHPWYMVGVITPVFSMVWFCMLFVYWRIWREAAKHVKQLRITGMGDGPSDWKSVQVVLLILGCFTICWLPYFIVACAQIFKFMESSSPIIYKAAFSLAMSNSAMNPLIYAWKNTGFRRAFSRLLKCKSPDTMEPSQSMRSNLHRKSSSIQHQDSVTNAFPNFSTPPFMQRKVDPLGTMGVTFEEDEDKLSTHNPQPTTPDDNDNNINDQQISICIETDTNNSIIISTSKFPHANNSQIIINQDHIQNNQVQKKVSSGNNGMLSLKAGNLIVNALENYVNDEESNRKEFKENFLNVHSTSPINKKSKFKSRSANSVVITPSPNKSNSHNCISNKNNKNQLHSLKNSENNSKQSIEYVINEKSASRKFLSSFNFGGSNRSCAGSVSGDLCNNIGQFNESKIVCKIVDRS
ncbi:unnamed protein product [Diamesa serratosioi]